MNSETPEQLEQGASLTRMLFLGEAALCDGFRLIGFETWPDATQEVLDAQLETLLRQRLRAFVVLDQTLSGCNSELLQQVRGEGGHIIVTQVPSLAEPGQFTCDIDNRLQQLIGGTTESVKEPEWNR